MTAGVIARFTYMLLSAGGLCFLIARWRVVKVLTRDRRFLFVFLLLQMCNAILSGVLKTLAHIPADWSSYLTVVTQGFLLLYLLTSVPRANRYPWPQKFWRKVWTPSLLTVRPLSGLSRRSES